MSVLQPKSEPVASTRAREVRSRLWIQVYLPVGLTGLAALLGAAVLSYGAFTGLIDHALLAETLLILVLTPALFIAFLVIVLITAFTYGLSHAYTRIASLLRDGQLVSTRANRSARNYAHKTKMRFERIHRLANAPTQALRSFQQRLRGLW
jgi:hypothetical protein